MKREAMLKKIAAMLPRSSLERILGVDLLPHLMIRLYLQERVVRQFPDDLCEEAKRWIDSVPDASAE